MGLPGTKVWPDSEFAMHRLPKIILLGLILPASGWAQEPAAEEEAAPPAEAAADPQPTAAPASPPAAAETGSMTPVLVELKNDLTLTGTIRTSDAMLFPILSGRMQVRPSIFHFPVNLVTQRAKPLPQ